MSKDSKAPQLSPEEEAQKKDEQYLAQNTREIEEILSLLDSGVDRDEAEKRVGDAKADVESRRQGMVFHDHKGRRIAVRGHVSNLLRLAQAKEVSLITKRHHKDLHKALYVKVRRRNELLDRIHERGLDFV
jgi:hypothetical protein